MNKLVSLVAGFIVAVAAVAVVNGVSSPALATDCTNGTKYSDFSGSYDGNNTLTVWTKGNKKLCKDVNVNFTSYKILNNYDGKGWSNNPTALPQTKFFNKTVTLKKGTDGKTSVQLQVPDACTPYQIDAYIGPVQNEIKTKEGLIGTNAIVYQLFKATKTDCNPPVEKTIEVCRLSDKKYPVTIKESEFDSSEYSKDPNDCKETPEEKCPVPGKEHLPKDSEDCEEDTPTELPETGPAEAFASLIGAGALTGTTATYLRSRRARQ